MRVLYDRLVRLGGHELWVYFFLHFFQMFRLQGFSSYSIHGGLRYFCGEGVLVFRGGYGGVPSHPASGTMVRLLLSTREGEQ